MKVLRRARYPANQDAGPRAESAGANCSYLPHRDLTGKRNDQVVGADGYYFHAIHMHSDYHIVKLHCKITIYLSNCQASFGRKYRVKRKVVSLTEIARNEAVTKARVTRIAKLPLR